MSDAKSSDSLLNPPTRSEAEARCEAAGRVLLQAVKNANAQGPGPGAKLTLVHGIEAALIILDGGKS